MSQPVNTGRLRKVIARHLAGGWTRAVFAEVGEGAAEPEILERAIDAGTPSAVELDEIVERALAAARAGRVKQTFFLDPRTRVRLDARFGKAKVQTLDDATVSKMMGGKDRPLRPDRSAELLRAIGLMNADGTISAKHAKKYKQVNHFVELCRPVLERLSATRAPTGDAPLRVVDLGCGNAYLTFVLAEALRLADVPARLHGVDVRPDVVERSRRRAATLGWPHVTFEVSAIDAASPQDAPPDLVLALHACDTATDDAIARGVRLGAGALLIAPCCQHELAGQLDRHSEAPIPALVQHGLFKQEYAAMLTDALRVEILAACGYRVDILEFVASEHTPKNTLIRAIRRAGAQAEVDEAALAAIAHRCTTLGIDPSLLRQLQQQRHQAEHD